MSTESLASSFLSYGADLRVKNIVLEITFSILPILYESPYKILDPSDELIVDLMFQYVKRILFEREQYRDIVVPLLEEQFPDLKLHDLQSTQISLLANIALKRLVAQAVTATTKSLYQYTGFPKQNFMKNYLKNKFRLRDSHAFDFRTKLTHGDPAAPGGFFGPGSTTEKTMTAQYRKYELSDSGKPALVIEPFMSMEFKSKSDLILCVEDLQEEFSVKSINNYIVNVAKVLGYLTVGTTMWKKYDEEEPVLNNPNLDILDGKKVYFARDMFIEAMGDYYLPSLTGKEATTLSGYKANLYKFSQGKQALKVLDALTNGISVGLRTSLERGVQHDPNDPLGQTLVDTALSPPLPEALKAVNFGKTLYYKTWAKIPTKTKVIDGVDVEEYIAASTDYLCEGKGCMEIQMITMNLAEVEQKYDVLDLSSGVATKDAHRTTPYSKNALFAAAACEGTNWNLEHLFALASATASSNPPTNMAESLFITLLQSDDFDSLTKSLLVPATVFNAIQFVPNAEIGSVMRNIMRSRGIFSGLDEALDAYMNSVKNYLFGDFPFMTDCSLEGLI